MNFSEEQLWGGIRVWKAMRPSVRILSAWLLSEHTNFNTWKYSLILKAVRLVSQGCRAVSSSQISLMVWSLTIWWSSPRIKMVRFVLISGGVTGSRFIFLSSVMPLGEVIESMVSGKSE